MLLQFILSPQCLNCSSWTIQSHLFCSDCFQKTIHPKIVKNFKFFENSPHIFLIPWALDDRECIDQLVYRLKNLQSYFALKDYAKKLRVVLLNLNLKKSNNILIPIPSSRRKYNHAHALAKLLSEEGFGQYHDVLSKHQGNQQKYLSRSLRAQNRFFIKKECEVFTHSLKLKTQQGHQVLFIDDILTTGESFKRCSELLGIASNALCVTLFYREKA